MKHIALPLLFTLTANFSIVSSSLAQTTTLQIVNARASELFPIPGARIEDKCAFQGCADADYAQTIVAIRIDRVFPWLTKPTKPGLFKTEPVAVCPLETDGSIKCVIPCNIDYQLVGVTATGAVNATDHSVHHATCGEVVTCHGCHDGHSVERQALYGKTAVERFSTTLAAKKTGQAPGC